MRLSDRRIRLLLLALAAAVAVSLPVTGYERHWLQSLELETHSARFAVRGDEPPPDDTVIVAIDDRTLDDHIQELVYRPTLH